MFVTWKGELPLYVCLFRMFVRSFHVNEDTSLASILNQLGLHTQLLMLAKMLNAKRSLSIQFPVGFDCFKNGGDDDRCHRPKALRIIIG